MRAFERLAELGEKHKKPVIITETGYHTLTRPELQGKVVKSLVDAARTRTAGIFVFQFADQWSKAGSPNVQDRHVEGHWGIVTRAGKPKNGFFALKEVYAKIKKSGPEEADRDIWEDYSVKLAEPGLPALRLPVYILMILRCFIKNLAFFLPVMYIHCRYIGKEEIL